MSTSREQLSESLKILNGPPLGQPISKYPICGPSILTAYNNPIAIDGCFRLVREAKKCLEHHDWENLAKFILLYVDMDPDYMFYMTMKKFALIALKYDPMIERKRFLEHFLKVISIINFYLSLIKILFWFFLKGVLWLNNDDEIKEFLLGTEMVPAKTLQLDSKKFRGLLTKRKFNQQSL